MKLLDKYLDDCLEELQKEDIRFIFLGDRSIFPESMRQKMKNIEDETKNNLHIVNLALNYGGRDEIVHAANQLLRSGKDQITEEDMASAMYTAESPELDLIVRTGGDLRISNFLLWQSAYSAFLCLCFILN